MTRSERLFALIQALRRHRQPVTAQKLATELSVSVRTIYRDIEALDAMGVPVWQLDGKFGIEREGYQSTVRLNLNETVALYFAARLLAHHSDENNPHVVGALDKIAASLPDATLSEHMSRAAEVIRAKPMRSNYVQIVEILTRAWADRRVAVIQYWAADRAEPQEVEPPRHRHARADERERDSVVIEEVHQASVWDSRARRRARHKVSAEVSRRGGLCSTSSGGASTRRHPSNEVPDSSDRPFARLLR